METLSILMEVILYLRQVNWKTGQCPYNTRRAPDVHSMKRSISFALKLAFADIFQ